MKNMLLTTIICGKVFTASYDNSMTEKNLKDRRFYKAEQEIDFVEKQLSTPQTEDPAYKLAFQDNEFMLREELRPIRFQLELLKPEMLLDEANIESTFVIYGSARIGDKESAQKKIDAAKTERDVEIANRLMKKARYYDEARKLAQLASECGISEPDGKRHFVVCSGGGPAIMEAANRGAHDVGKESIGLNIVLPFEQAPNKYVTPQLSFQFHYFALRKMHFLIRARAVAVFPGGFGTFDEFFELLTLVQTRKMEAVPIFLFGSDFWNRVINFEELALEGTISTKDLDLFQIVDDADEAWQKTLAFYNLEDC